MFDEFYEDDQRKSLVHNQKIERHWRDVYCKVLDKYHRIFYSMERMGILDVNNATHISVLHFVFGPRIQKDLDQWRLTHNNHPVRTEKNETHKPIMT